MGIEQKLQSLRAFEHPDDLFINGVEIRGGVGDPHRVRWLAGFATEGD